MCNRWVDVGSRTCQCGDVFQGDPVLCPWCLNKIIRDNTSYYSWQELKYSGDQKAKTRVLALSMMKCLKDQE